MLIFHLGWPPKKKTPTSHKNYITCGGNIVFSSLVGCLFRGLAQIENCQNLHPSFLVCNGLQDVNSPLGFLRHLVSVMRMEPGGLLSAAVVCGSWTLINRYLAKWCIWDWTLKKTEVGMEDNSQTFLFAAFFWSINPPTPGNTLVLLLQACQGGTSGLERKQSNGTNVTWLVSHCETWDSKRGHCQLKK